MKGAKDVGRDCTGVECSGRHFWRKREVTGGWRRLQSEGVHM